MLRMVQGANYDPLFSIIQSEEELDVSSAEITITVKETKDAVASEVFQKQNLAAGGDSSEIEMGPDNHQFTMHVLPTDTSSLTNLDKEYWLELEVVLAGSSIKWMNQIYIEQSLTA